MNQKTYSMLFWVALSIACVLAYCDLFISATLWMLISAVYLVGGDIAAAIRSMK